MKYLKGVRVRLHKKPKAHRAWRKAKIKAAEGIEHGA
jgi:hypothetical protein